MRIYNCNNFNFKGYDALPLKRIYAEKNAGAKFEKEMQEVAQKEGFEFCLVEDDNWKWMQDQKTIIEKFGHPYIIAKNKSVSSEFMSEMANRFGINSHESDSFSTGGNTFIGKYPNGEKWMLIGEKENLKDLDMVSRTYGIKRENIFTIPQQNFHIDMNIRPVGYPYVLVNDPDLVNKKFNNLQESWRRPKASYFFESDHNQLNKRLKEEGYSDCNSVCDALAEAGFIPIRIAGVYTRGINFMNAIVNKHEDGTMTYITNNPNLRDSAYCDTLKEDFAKTLKEMIPEIKNVYFIGGETDTTGYNPITQSLNWGNGGLHCMTLEEPNFDIWG